MHLSGIGVVQKCIHDGVEDIFLVNLSFLYVTLICIPSVYSIGEFGARYYCKCGQPGYPR